MNRTDPVQDKAMEREDVQKLLAQEKQLRDAEFDQRVKVCADSIAEALRKSIIQLGGTPVA